MSYSFTAVKPKAAFFGSVVDVQSESICFNVTAQQSYAKHNSKLKTNQSLKTIKCK